MQVQEKEEDTDGGRQHPKESSRIPLLLIIIRILILHLHLIPSLNPLLPPRRSRLFPGNVPTMSSGRYRCRRQRRIRTKSEVQVQEKEEDTDGGAASQLIIWKSNKNQDGAR